MAVGRLVLAGLAAAGAYGAWRARQQGGSAARGLPAARGSGPAPSAAAGAVQAATTLPDQSSPLPAEPTGGGDSGTGAPATTSSGAAAGASPSASAAASAAEAAATLPDQSSPLPAEPTGGTDRVGDGAGGTGEPGRGTPAGEGGAADVTAGTTALDGTTGGSQRDALPVPSPLGADPAAGGGVEGTAPLHGSGTRADDPLTGVTEPAGDLPEATASPDGTPAAGPVETRRVGDDPA